MLYTAQKSCVFSRRIEFSVTQENTANLGEFRANRIRGLKKKPPIQANSRRIEFATTSTKSAQRETKEKGKLSQHWYDFSPCSPISSLSA